MIKASELRDSFEVRSRGAVRVDDLFKILNEERPQIVQFSGHGTQAEEILLVDDAGQIETGRQRGAGEPVPSYERQYPRGRLEHLFLAPASGSHRGTHRLAVGNRMKIRGDRAIKFTSAFYRAIGSGRSVKDAVEQVRAALLLDRIPIEELPQLLVRSGVDAAKVFPALGPIGAAAFLVQIRPVSACLGREKELAELRDCFLQESQRPARVSLVGMGGVGKTRLAFEYASRNRSMYPDGVFWINAANVLTDGFAVIGKGLRPESAALAQDVQIHAAFDELKKRPGSLLIVDNRAKPAELFWPTFFESLHPSELPCQILITTQEKHGSLDAVRMVEVDPLSAESALLLLLGDPLRKAACVSDHPEHEQALRICNRLGRFGFLP